MATATRPEELKKKVSSGFLSFPLTDFDDTDRFDAGAYARRLKWLGSYGASAIFAAGGAGEFFSLTNSEYCELIQTAVAAQAGSGVPVIAATGYGTRMAVSFAKDAERLGADGLLMLPPYLVEATQEGLYQHIKAVCDATAIGIIVYNRANGQLKVETLQRLLDVCPNLIGFKDGIGNFEDLLRVREYCGDRVAMINGMPTAEVFAQAFMGMGIGTYSSAIFNFVPRSAAEFNKAVLEGDKAFVTDFMKTFLLPYRLLCSRHPSYAVSMIKAGATIVGRNAGLARPPLSMPTEEEQVELAELIARLGKQEPTLISKTGHQA